MKAHFCCFLMLLSFRLSVARSQNVIHMSQEFPEEKEYGDDKAPLKSAATVEKPKGFSFASYYGDHMVLQRAPHRATLWGYHPDPGSRIIVQVKGRKVYSATVDKTGVWRVLLEAEASAGPFTIVALSETKAIHLNDVLFGDVWLCSGQSNMAFTLDMAFNATEELKEAKKFHNIRVFTVERQYSLIPLPDLVAVLEKWSVPDNATLGRRGQYFSAICWLYGKYLSQRLGYPIGLIDSTWGGTPIQSWMSADALKTCGIKPPTQTTPITNLEKLQPRYGNEMEVGGIKALTTQQDHTELWNAMIHPFLPMTIYGVLWDQGENDAPKPSTCNVYNCTFPAMIDDWRSKFSEASAGQTKLDFPFGFVQIGANYKDSVIASGFPDIRWHQTADYGYVPNPKMKNVFMAVSMDITDFNSPFGSVHTRDKETITHRLFLGGLDVAYNISTFWHGPLPVRVSRSSSTLVLDYGTTWTLELRQKEGFELCCSLDGGQSCQLSEGRAWWVPTPIMTSNATHVELYAGVCGTRQGILGLRYAWRLTPCPLKKCAVYSKENSLPAPPFVAYPSGLASGQDVTLDLDWSKPVHV